MNDLVIDKKKDKVWSVMGDDGQKRNIFVTDKEFYMYENENIVVAKDEKELYNYLNKGIFKKHRNRPNKYFIKGYMVNDCVPNSEVEVEGYDLPLYHKRRDSVGVIYSAGYYAISYRDGWKVSSNTTLATLKKYEFLGPYHSHKEALRDLKIISS